MRLKDIVRGEDPAHVLNFNSSEVRLKASWADSGKWPKDISIPVRCDWRHPTSTGIFRKIRDFNSSEVRLKGMIKSGVSISRRHFNSSEVRLKAEKAALIFNWAADFNSSEVRLKVARIDVERGFVLYFNSSEVRLKAGFPSLNASCLARFQFQWGAIEGIAASTRLVTAVYFNSSEVRLKVCPAPFCPPGGF